MSVFNGAFPILPGKIDAAREFAKGITGDRKSDFDAMQNRVGTTREMWSLQETPGGAFMLVWFEGNVDEAFSELATAKQQLEPTKAEARAKGR